MSNVSNFHVFNSYSGSEVALSGQRLVKVTFKTDKETGIKPESKCVSIPNSSELSAEILDNWNLVERHVLGYFEEIQNKIIREKVEAGNSGVTSQEIGFFSLLGYLDEEKTSGRLSKQLLSFWFEDEIEPALSVALGNKLGIQNNSPTPAQEKTLTLTINRFKSWIESLAGAKTLLASQVLEQLRKLLSLEAISDSPLKEKILARISFMEEQNKLLDSTEFSL